MDICELSAEKKCGHKNYLVIERHVPPPKGTADPKKNSTAHDIAGAMGQSQVSGRNDGTIGDRDDAFSIVVECDPPPSTTTAGATTTYPTATPPKPSAEDLAARERNKASYMKEVCELVNPDLRRDELRIARQLFGDVSCNPTTD
jgi:hypothetical protein